MKYLQPPISNHKNLFPTINFAIFRVLAFAYLGDTKTQVIIFEEMKSLTEGDLIILFAKIAVGDEESYTEVYNAYYDQVYSFAFQFCKTRPIAEDVTQQVFTILWEQRDDLTNVSKPSAWMWIITRNQAIKFLRKESVNESYISHLKEHFQSERETPISRLIVRQKQILIESLVNRLPLRQQKIYRMSRYNGETYASIGKILGISQETVKEHMAKALKRIRGLLLAHKEELLFLTFCLFS